MEVAFMHAELQFWHVALKRFAIANIIPSFMNYFMTPSGRQTIQHVMSDE
jgi:hypothetical protein